MCVNSKPVCISHNANKLEKGGARGGACGGDRGVMVIVIGNGHGDTSSNPVRD